MIINHNLGASNAIRNMNVNSANASKSMEKLSSGLRINKAGDDAAGLAISEKMRGQIRGLDQASANAQDGISMVQTAEGALNETTSILQRMRELAVQASNDTNTSDDRTQIQKEMNQLTSEISRIGNNTEFNTQKLLNGTSGSVSPATTAAAPAQVTVGAMTFDFSSGSALNGYKIKLGTVADGTTTSASVDTTNKIITLNGDFDNADTNAQYATKANIESAINGQLSAKGFSQAVTVGGTIGATATGTTSAALSGGQDTKSATSSFTFQIGANKDQQFTASISDMRSAALGISGSAGGTNAGGVTGAAYVGLSGDTLSDGTTGVTDERALDVSSAANATAAIKVIDNATSTVSSERAKLGAYQNRLEHTIANLGTSSENLTSAESRIRDVDMAKEMSTFSKNNILSQAAQAMLAQANQQPQQVLQLLR